MRAVVHRYLDGYGPASSDDFGRWWGIDASAAKRLFRFMENDIVEVEVDAWRGWLRPAVLSEIRAQRVVDNVRLLPNFDPYTIALYRHPFVMNQQFRSRVSRAQGWISPVVLVNGRIVGVWRYDRKSGGTTVVIELFEALDSGMEGRMAAEAERLGDFLGTDTDLEVSQL